MRTLKSNYRLIAVLVAAIAFSLIVLSIQESRHEAEVLAWQSTQRGYPPVTASVTMPIAKVDVTMTPMPTPEPTPTPEPRLTLTDTGRDLVAKIIWIEARGEPFEGQQAIAEAIFNRVMAENFPDTVEDVIFQSSDDVLQFASAPYIDTAEPEQAQYAAIDAALSGDNVLPEDVVYFSRTAENDRVWGEIGAHVFCYQYIWG